MDILFLLIPLSVITVMALIALFAWALHRGQFDNVEREGERILWDDGVPPAPTPASLPAPAPSKP